MNTLKKYVELILKLIIWLTVRMIQSVQL